MNVAQEDVMEAYSGTRMADKMQVETVFGDKAKQAIEARMAMTKAGFEAYKARTNALKPAFESRDKFVSGIPEFWLKTFTSYRPIEPCLDEVDLDALKSLKSFSVVYQEDPREYDLVFEFGESPYFGNKKLVKPFRLAELPAGGSSSSSSSNSNELAELRSYDLQWPLVTPKVSIDWTSPDHNLIKKKPRVNPTDLEEFDMADSLGSFFNFFEEDHDALDIAEHLEQIYQEALDIYAQLNSDLDSDDEDDEDDLDDAEEVDLEQDSDEERKKRKRSKK